MHLGLDVGTGRTKLARYQDEAPLALRTLVVPTAISYHGLASTIAAPVPSREPPADVVRCDGFPAMLGMRPPDRVTAWGGRTAVEVTQSFLLRLLSRFGGEEGPREGNLVITVPAVAAHPDHRPATHDGGTGLAEILLALGYPPQRVLPAPIAALAYLRRERAEMADATRFAVCDIGAGGMSFALCAATASAARVIDVIRMTGSAAWNDDTAPGATAGDRPVTLVERLVAEVARTVGAPAAVPGDRRSVYRWRALEAALDNPGEPGSPGHDLHRVFGAGGAPRAFGPLRFADIETTVSQVLDACAPLADTAGAALARLLARRAEPDWRTFGTGPATRIVLIGGLTGLGTVRAALLRAAGLDSGDPGHAVVEAGPAARLGIAARGAALVAAGKADPIACYPYALRLPVHRTVLGRIESSSLELAAANTIAPDQTETSVEGADGAPVVVTVPASGGFVLPVELVPRDGAPPIPAGLSPAQTPPVGDYRISVSGHPEGAAIVLRSVKDDTMRRYVLRQPAAPASGTE